MRSMVEPGSKGEHIGRLLIAAFVIIALPALPFGSYLIYPFAILTTWFHEMGHGLSALLMGQDFLQLMIFADGSGVANYAIDGDLSPFSRAFIAAGGPLAPSVIGAALIIASAHPKLWRPTLWALAAVIFASVIVYVRSPVGYAVLPIVAAFLCVVAWKASAGITRFTLQFLGVIAAMSMLRDFNYLFTQSAMIGGQQMLSDTGQIEASLLLPHWVWAALILMTSATMITLSLKYALSDKRRLGAAGRSGRKLPANVLQFKRGPED